MIKVKRLAKETFKALLDQPLSEKDKAIIMSLYKAQRQYPLLTYSKYLLFWTIYNKYIKEAS